ncbi:MAG: alpha/beta hydrolase [Clostridia bacterium]|nr:alpha/beta hydrolase [Clostridia bacterium]
MKRSTKSILISSGVAATTMATIAGAAFTAGKYLMKVALDRELPKSSDKNKARLTGSKKLIEFSKTIEESAEKFESTEGIEQVEITTQDEVVLVGHWYECPNAKRIIVAMHGWRSSWSKDFGMIADFWHSNGCSVLYAEQRGQNNSGGEYMGFGMLERHDCLEWVKWVNERTESSLPVYLAGVSMGASTVLMASGLEMPENVHGIMADCGFTSPHAIWKHVAEKNLHLSYGIIGKIANDMCRKKINMGAKDYSATYALSNSNIPVIFVHGSDDKFVPIEMTYENYKACAAPKRLLVVPGAEHGMSYYTDKESYEKALLEFWQDYDEKKPISEKDQTEDAPE